MHRSGAADAGFRNRDMFEMSNIQRNNSPPLPLLPLVLSIFLLEDEDGEPGVCEVSVAVPAVDSSAPPPPHFYNDVQATSARRQA